MKKKNKKHMHEDPAGIFVPAGIFLGLGLGGFVGNYGAGVLFGLGAGLLVMALIKISKK
ncbi:MAG: hypothetical protein ABIH59_01670 [archaeon]